MANDQKNTSSTAQEAYEKSRDSLERLMRERNGESTPTPVNLLPPPEQPDRSLIDQSTTTQPEPKPIVRNADGSESLLPPPDTAQQAACHAKKPDTIGTLNDALAGLFTPVAAAESAPQPYCPPPTPIPQRKPARQH